MSERRDEAPVILVVEDEFLIRIMIADGLRDAGFSVFECNTADDAIDLLRSGGFRIDAVFTDVRMPGLLDGVDLAVAVRAEFPRIRMIITSAQTLHVSVPEPFLAKPYATSRVIELLNELLGTRLPTSS